jgi:energy-coupling factor transporter ATP-binding protein EcfA2
MRGLHRAEMGQRIQVAADIFGISHLLFRHPRTLSGGETQKVVIASSYVLKPELWILDRPLTELDPLARYKFLQEIELLAKQKGITFIITEEPAADLYSIATHRNLMR